VAGETQLQRSNVALHMKKIAALKPFSYALHLTSVVLVKQLLSGLAYFYYLSNGTMKKCPRQFI
jgi:hypothetical protein